MTAEAANGVAAAGDEVARLYDQYGAKLQRFCMSRLRSHEEAEDAVQSTFLRVYTALRKGSVPQYEAACSTRSRTTSASPGSSPPAAGRGWSRRRTSTCSARRW